MTGTQKQKRTGGQPVNKKMSSITRSLFWSGLWEKVGLYIKADLVLFLAIVFPIALCQVINIRGGEEISFLGLTIPKLIDARQNATSILGGGGLAAPGGLLLSVSCAHSTDGDGDFLAVHASGFFCLQ